MQISGETASASVNSSSLSDLSNVTNATLYGFEDYHGVDIGVVKAARLWYSCIGGELELEIPLVEGDTRLGFAISRTEEVLFLLFTSTLHSTHSYYVLLQKLESSMESADMVVFVRVLSTYHL
jgi:hypothetical protein